VLDLTWVWAGPTVTCQLADLGAEVIKIESIKKLDYNRLRRIYHERGNAKISNEDHDLIEKVSMFHNVNRNKLSATLNLQSSAGIDLLKQLVKKCDIIVENFSPPVLKKLGLDYNSLRQIREDIIMLSMTGAGQNGPLKNLKAYGPTISSLVGLESLIGYPRERAIGMLSIGFSDPSSAVHATTALLAAIYHHQKTGEGQYIDLSELESMAALLPEPIMDFVMNNRVNGPRGNEHPSLAPHGVYPCKNDRWISIAVGSDEEWSRLCEVIGRQTIPDELVSIDQEHRRLNRVKIDNIISQWTSQFTMDEAQRKLQQSGVASSSLLNPEEVNEHEFFLSRGLESECVHPVTGPEKVISVPWKMSATPPKVMKSAPLLGEHNSYVFMDLLKLPETKFKQLISDQVIY